MSTPIVYLRDVQKRPRFFQLWEKRRHTREVHWAMECFAEMLGVFFYVYFGIGSQVGWNFGNVTQAVGFSSVLQIGLAYAMGIVFAISVCSSTSGGHFNPCMTIAYCTFRGFPKIKGLRYIVAQLLGAYIGALVVYTQWKEFIVAAEGTLEQAGTLASLQFTPNGPVGSFANFLAPGQTLPRVFMNEYVTCTVLAIIIWACIDPTNVFVPPATGTFVIALAYATAIWGFAVPGVSLNAARDVGARLAAMTIWGLEAKGSSYSAITALVNIPATLTAAFIYEFFLTDSDRVVDSAHLEFINVHANHRRLRSSVIAEKRNSRVQSLVNFADSNSQEKPIVTLEDMPTENQV
ncbi:aquaporin-like protein [Gymnopilus junonius]|uniref:Aquaporin-like protein n=1 Tax=Gymnopilus junonius TaxID=109634 RepID=A0A9P5TT71_GYMJU|nr:aquaporin-like protein [Gymnopilus junonius]